MALQVNDIQVRPILGQDPGPATRSELKASTLPLAGVSVGGAEELNEAVLVRRIQDPTGLVSTWAWIILPTSTLTDSNAIAALNRYANLAKGSRLDCNGTAFIKTGAPGTDTWALI
jgi:hypothetical protein